MFYIQNRCFKRSIVSDGVQTVKGYVMLDCNSLKLQDSF
jgi:hypothetical protein